MERVRYWSYVVLDGQANCVGHAHSYTRAAKMLKEIKDYGSNEEGSSEEGNEASE